LTRLGKAAQLLTRLRKATDLLTRLGKATQLLARLRKSAHSRLRKLHGLVLGGFVGATTWETRETLWRLEAIRWLESTWAPPRKSLRRLEAIGWLESPRKTTAATLLLLRHIPGPGALVILGGSIHGLSIYCSRVLGGARKRNDNVVAGLGVVSVCPSGRIDHD